MLRYVGSFGLVLSNVNGTPGCMVSRTWWERYLSVVNHRPAKPLGLKFGAHPNQGDLREEEPPSCRIT